MYKIANFILGLLLISGVLSKPCSFFAADDVTCTNDEGDDRTGNGGCLCVWTGSDCAESDIAAECNPDDEPTPSECDDAEWEIEAIGLSTQFRVKNECNDWIKVKMASLSELDGDTVVVQETGFASTDGWQPVEQTDDFLKNTFDANAMSQTGANLTLETYFFLQNIDFTNLYGDIIGVLENELKFAVTINWPNGLQATGNQIELCIDITTSDNDGAVIEAGPDVKVGGFEIRNEQDAQCDGGDLDVVITTDPEPEADDGPKVSICYTFATCGDVGTAFTIEYDPTVSKSEDDSVSVSNVYMVKMVFIMVGIVSLFFV